ncbi:MAG: protein-L-isoaspartate(D-aspartate) O-methyltransferase [Nitrospirae bacterium]|nr:MAG: protein-L-isoaspartate(D-aspartate) O-methyltransferase [Nitrospirota bacterium]
MQPEREAVAPRARERRALVEVVRRQGVQDPRVLAAMERVPRHRFVPEALQGQAYRDTSLPIGHGQTISQPSIVGLMTQAAAPGPGDRVLELGTGSGYQTAILAELAAKVFTVERVHALAVAAQRRLEALGYTNVVFRIADGTFGWAEHAPYQAILVAAAAPEVPPPLLQQLDDGGRLVIPVGGAEVQELLLVRRAGDRFESQRLLPCRFVKLVGRHGWRG